MSKLAKGLTAAGIPVYVIGGFFIGRYLGEKFGNPAVGIILGFLIGLCLALYDVYIIAIKSDSDDEHG
jgi:F0F1-type ATP synthase assembly protein I